METKLHLEKTTGEERPFVFSLAAKKSQSCLKCAIKHCVWSKEGGHKPYLSCDTIQRQLHMWCVVCCIPWRGLAWLGMHTDYRVASMTAAKP